MQSYSEKHDGNEELKNAYIFPFPILALVLCPNVPIIAN